MNTNPAPPRGRKGRDRTPDLSVAHALTLDLPAHLRHRSWDEVAWLSVVRDGMALEAALPVPGREKALPDPTATVPSTSQSNGVGRYRGPRPGPANGLGHGSRSGDAEREDVS